MGNSSKGHTPIDAKDRKNVVIDFTDSEVAYAGLTTTDILRALMVFRVCSTRPIVQNADTVMKYAYKVLGRTITDTMVRHTFFRHFCAGETHESIRPRVNLLRANGVGGILDYAAEADVAEPPTTSQEELTHAYSEGEVICRVYDYQSELQCDAHVKTFLDCIQAVHDVTPEGFAAIKLTALGNPILLERMSTCIVEIRRLFQKFDTERKGYITRKEFTEVRRMMCLLFSWI